MGFILNGTLQTTAPDDFHVLGDLDVDGTENVDTTETIQGDQQIKGDLFVDLGGVFGFGTSKFAVESTTGDIATQGFIRQKEQAGDPANVADHGFTYSKEVAAVTELFYRDSAGNVNQITSGGAGPPVAAGWSHVGTVIRQTTLTDTVALGAAAMVGTEKLLVVPTAVAAIGVRVRNAANSADSVRLTEDSQVIVGASVIINGTLQRITTSAGDLQLAAAAAGDIEFLPGGVLAMTFTAAGSATFNNAVSVGTTLSSPSVGPSSGQQHTLPAVASDTVVLVAATQTLTAKTLTSPTISGPTFSGTLIGTYTIGGVPTLGATLALGGQTLSGNATLTGTLTGGTFSGPTLSGTVAGSPTFSGVLGHTSATPLTFTNGQLLTLTITAQTVGAAALTIPNFAGVADTFVFTTLAQTLANKTLTSPTINGATISGTFAGTATFSGANTFSATQAFTNASPFSVANAQTLTFSVAAQTVGPVTLTIPNFAGVSDTLVFVTLAQTLANKTLTLPTIADFTNSNHTHQSVAGGGVVKNFSYHNWGMSVLLVNNDFATPGGYAAGNANEIKMRVPTAFDITKMSVRARVAGTVLNTFTLRKNAANTGNVVDIVAGTTGDNATVVSFAAGDDLSIQFATGGVAPTDVVITLEVRSTVTA